MSAYYDLIERIADGTERLPLSSPQESLVLAAYPELLDAAYNSVTLKPADTVAALAAGIGRSHLGTLLGVKLTRLLTDQVTHDVRQWREDQKSLDRQEEAIHGKATASLYRDLGVL